MSAEAVAGIFNIPPQSGELLFYSQTSRARRNEFAHFFNLSSGVSVVKVFVIDV